MKPTVSKPSASKATNTDSNGGDVLKVERHEYVHLAPEPGAPTGKRVQIMGKHCG